MVCGPGPVARSVLQGSRCRVSGLGLGFRVLILSLWFVFVSEMLGLWFEVYRGVFGPGSPGLQSLSGVPVFDWIWG